MQTKQQLRSGRAARASQRSAGVSAAERYVEGSGIHPMLRTLAPELLHGGGGRSDDDASFVPSAVSNKRSKRDRVGWGGSGDEMKVLPGERDLWDECGQCGMWVNLGRSQVGWGAHPASNDAHSSFADDMAGLLPALACRCLQDEGDVPHMPCAGCGADVVWRGHTLTQGWIQCDDCGRWRTLQTNQLRCVQVYSCVSQHKCTLSGDANSG